MKSYTVTSDQINNMKHCIGFKESKVKGIKHRKMESYRNYYTTTERDAELDKLIDQGLMGVRKYLHGCGEDPHVYWVTEEGYKFLSNLTAIEIKQAE